MEEVDHDGASPEAPEPPQPQYTPYMPYITRLQYESGENPAYQPFSIPNGGKF
jgi:hypothetical protein